MKNTNLKLANQVLSPLAELKNQAREIVRLEKKIIFSDSDLEILYKLNDKTASDYLDIIKSGDKNNILAFVKSNNIILAKLQDAESAWRVAVVKINDSFYLNANLDASYGQQSENPRLTRQGLLNAFLNFDLQTEKLNHAGIIWIQDEILNKTDNLERFEGDIISNRGFYDNPIKSDKKTADNNNNLSVW